MMRVVVAALLFSLCACTPTDARGKPDAQKPAPITEPAQGESLFQNKGTVVVHAPGGDQTFAVELAITPKERERGLMHREQLADDAGMLFLFEREKVQSFWMKNTRIPLDMVFIAQDGTIAGIVENAEPLTLTSRNVALPSRYVLEVNGGLCRKRGIAAGQRVRFEGVPVDKVDARVLQ
jgi:uncharacterized protein